MDAIDSCLVKIHQVASDSDWGAHKLVTAGAAPALIHLLKTRAAEIDGLEIVLITLGALAANTIYRTNTAITLIELCKSSISCEVSVLSIWCLIRICRSAEVAQGLIKANIVPVLLKQSALGDVHLDAMSVYCLGTLVQNDASAELLSLMDIIPFVVNHLRQSTESPTQNSDHICAGLYAIARISRSIKLAKSLAKAGCIDLLSYHLRTSDDPNVLNYSCRAIGCLMRPNSSDMAKVLLEADIAKGLARLPTVLSSGKLQALGSLGFAVQRFSCAEWSGKIRQTLVEAGVVDSLLAALRTASEEPCYDVHIELALGLSLLGDVGGSSIRKEIVNAGGITILKAVAHNNTDVAKACNTAITSISGNIWSRNAASAKTAMAHNWNGGCPDYLPPCPLVLQVF
ncbi:armadillo-type protein [Rhodocollybia butyracea]|uniref:Armadillo-type protein n=1 Tax=Rhodocollybia butyracea TaxID=206335 RepID=A0A9P5QAM6_9AGAR|nr:armadillo-type protein [Rhodocollybia butyracea]